MMPCTSICAQRPGARPAFFVFSPGSLALDHGMGEREGCDVVETTGPQAGQTAQLSTLQFREKGRDRALPALSLQTTGSHATAARGNRETRRVGGCRRVTHRRELLRHPLSLDSPLRWWSYPVNPIREHGRPDREPAVPKRLDTRT